MAYFWICFVVLLKLALGDKQCPPPKDLAPCTCDGQGVNCMNARNLDEIKKAFRAHFPYGATRSVWVQGTPITSLPADLFGNIKSRAFYVEISNITSVDLDAFRGSRKSLKILSLFGNKIVDFPFNDITRFEKLGNLNLGQNMIERIPDNAFSHSSIWELILTGNPIKYIGANAFANLPSLEKLDMAFTQIVTLGPMSMAMKKHSDLLEINLTANKISNISSTAFQGVDAYTIYFSQNQLTSLKKDVFEPLVVKTAQHSGFLEVSNNPLSCKGCDYSWIAINKDALASKLVGFTCHDGSSIHDLTKSSIGCH